MSRLLVAALAGLCACTKSAPADAGTVIERGTDLRSAVTTIFPEYRGAQMTAGRVALTRTLAPAGKAELDAAVEGAKKNGFTGEPLMRPPFTLEPRLDGQALELEVRMGLSPDEMVRVLSAPQAMTTEALANWIPKLSAPKVSERFELELVWHAKSVARADFLVWQLVDGALSAGWKVDALPAGWNLHGPDGGGPGAVPEEFTLVMRQHDQGVRVELERKAERAKLDYVLTTFERR